MTRESVFDEQLPLIIIGLRPVISRGRPIEAGLNFVSGKSCLSVVNFQFLHVITRMSIFVGASRLRSGRINFVRGITWGRIAIDRAPGSRMSRPSGWAHARRGVLAGRCRVFACSTFELNLFIVSTLGDEQV